MSRQKLRRGFEICQRLGRSVNRRSRTFLSLATLALVQISCASLQVPMAPLFYSPEETLKSSSGGLEVRARPIVRQDEYLDLFDDFLPEIGIAAVWVEVRNARSDAVEVRAPQWQLETNGRRHRCLAPDDVLARYYEGRRVRMYTLSADGKARRELERIAFRPGSIGSSAANAGLIFFGIDTISARHWNQGAALLLDRISLPDGSRIKIRIDIAHASP